MCVNPADRIVSFQARYPTSRDFLSHFSEQECKLSELNGHRLDGSCGWGKSGHTQHFLI